MLRGKRSRALGPGFLFRVTGDPQEEGSLQPLGGEQGTECPGQAPSPLPPPDDTLWVLGNAPFGQVSRSCVLSVGQADPQVGKPGTQCPRDSESRFQRVQIISSACAPQQTLRDPSAGGRVDSRSLDWTGALRACVLVSSLPLILRA